MSDTTVADWLGTPLDDEERELQAAIQAELNYFAALPLDPWRPVGDNGLLAAQFGHDRHTPRKLGLTAPAKLTRKQYQGLVHAMLRGAHVGYENREHMTYSEGSNRNSGVTEDRRSILGQYPPYCDCSSYSGIWIPWDGSRFLKLPDLWNGDEFEGGYTGTLTEHGEAIEIGHTVPCDICLYGGTVWVPQHATMTIGNGRVISMGHQGDPGIYAQDLGGEMPIVAIRRYIVEAKA